MEATTVAAKPKGRFLFSLGRFVAARFLDGTVVALEGRRQISSRKRGKDTANGSPAACHRKEPWLRTAYPPPAWHPQTATCSPRQVALFFSAPTDQ